MPKFLDDIKFINSQGQECSVNEYGDKIDKLQEFDANRNNIENGTGLDTIVLKYSPGYEDETHKPSSTTGESDVCLGEANTSSGKRNILGGKLNVNTGSNNLIVGLRNDVSSNHNVVGGQDNTSSQGHSNLIGGQQNTVKNYSNIVAGMENTVSENGKSNLVVGEQNSLGRVVNSIICGDNDGLQIEKLIGGIKAGLGLLNNSDIQGKALFGYYNKPKMDTVLEVGNGTSLNKRSNAFEVLKDGSMIIGGVDAENNNATLPDYQVAPEGWLGFDSTVIEGDQNLAAGARNYVRGNYNITSGLFNTIFSTEIQKDENGNEKLDENGNPMPELVTRSLAIGYMNQVRKGDSAAIGDRNVVTGGNSIALAYKNKVYADAAVALGHSNTIGTAGQTGNAAQSSIATGEGNIITGTASFAANAYNEVKGDYAAAFGGNNHANGYASFVAGQENESTNQRNFVYGFKNKSSKSDSVLLGTGLVSDTAEKIVIVGNYNSNDNIVQGETLFAVGGGSSDSDRKNTLVVNRSNIYANAKLNFNDATGATVVAESLSIGTENNSAGEAVTAPPLARTYHSIRVGENNTVEAYKSGVFGVSNSLTGSIENSFIFGGYNTAIKSYSFIAGRGLQDKFRNEWWHPKFTIGRYNLDTEEIKDSIFVIGNGTTDSNRSNALRVTLAGDVIAGKSTDKNSESKALTTKDYVLERLDNYAGEIASSLLLANYLTKKIIKPVSGTNRTKIKTVVYNNPGTNTSYYSDLWTTCEGAYGSKYKITMDIYNTSTQNVIETRTVYEGSGFKHIVFQANYPNDQSSITNPAYVNIYNRIGDPLESSYASLSSDDIQVEIYLEGTCAYIYKDDGYDYYKF